jgi:hypothetical protein
VDIEDVDDIIGVASELKQRQADTLTVEEVEEVGRELDIPAEFVRRAIDELEARRRAAAEVAERSKLRTRWILFAAGLLLVVLVALAVAGQASLRQLYSTVEAARAQVHSVVERQAAVEARYQDQPATPERDAELAGAENRVRVEIRRYDAAAAEYNSAADSLPGRLWSGLFGLPRRVPMSDEVASW